MSGVDCVVITCIAAYPVAAVVGAFLYHAWKTTRGEADKQDLLNYTDIALMWGWGIVLDEDDGVDAKWLSADMAEG
jgi:hypothetical protein